MSTDGEPIVVINAHPGLSVADAGKIPSAIEELVSKVKELDKPRKMAHLKPDEWYCDDGKNQWERGDHIIQFRQSSTVLLLKEYDFELEWGLNFYGHDGLQRAKAHSDELNLASRYDAAFSALTRDERLSIGESDSKEEKEAVIDCILRGADVKVVENPQRRFSFSLNATDDPSAWIHSFETKQEAINVAEKLGLNVVPADQDQDGPRP